MNTNTKEAVKHVFTAAFVICLFVAVTTLLQWADRCVDEGTPNEDTGKMIANRYAVDKGPRPAPLHVPEPVVPWVFTERCTPPQYYQYVIPMQQPVGVAVAEAPAPSPFLNPHVEKIPYVNWMPYANE